MTTVNHTIGGFTIGAVLAWMFGCFWPFVIICSLIGAFPDAGSWVMWKFFGWDRWKLYNMCHPLPGYGGQWDKYGKYLPPWGLHTWVIDSIVHPAQPKFIFPKFPVTWQNESFLNWKYSKWEVAYAALELFITAVYALILCLVLR